MKKCEKVFKIEPIIIKINEVEYVWSKGKGNNGQKWHQTLSIQSKDMGRNWLSKSLDRKRHVMKRSNAKIRSTTKGKLSYRIRNRINGYLRRGTKGGRHWEDLVGYTIDDLRTQIEKQFKDGMTWETFMQGEIHIDHKIPLAVHNFEKPEDIDFKKAWALSNLQPLWAHDNLAKGSKLEIPFQPSLKL